MDRRGLKDMAHTIFHKCEQGSKYLPSSLKSKKKKQLETHGKIFQHKKGKKI